MEPRTTIKEFHKLIKQQQLKQIANLSGPVAELEARLNQNSQSSSKPPGLDLSKSKRKPGIKPFEKARGGQKGHTECRMSEPGDGTQSHRLGRCGLGNRLLSHDNILGLFGQTINPSTIQAALEQAYASSASFVEDIKNTLPGTGYTDMPVCKVFSPPGKNKDITFLKN